jgi:hypothetical protein
MLNEKDLLIMELHDINEELKQANIKDSLLIINKFFDYIGIEKRLKFTFVIEKQEQILKINLIRS